MKAKKPISEVEAFARLSTLCAGSEQCEMNMRKKIANWGLDSAATERVIDRLIDENYLNEERFAHAYANDKMRYQRWGRRKIDQGLRLLRISSEARRDALDSLPEDEYCEILQHILISKAQTIHSGTSYERGGKLIRFALGRGFEMPLILQHLPKQLQDEDYDIDADEVDVDED